MAERNQSLREFLRARRGSVSPESVGLGGGGSRRVPGLRREEVAQLAGVSVDYYIRLEQGRHIAPSDSVLDAVARALCLTPAQRSQLYTLVRGGAHQESRGEAVRPTAVQLLSALNVPALIVGRGTAVLASNAAHRALTTDFSQLPPERRFYAYWLFAEPAARELLAQWAESARETAGVLRTAVTQFPHDVALRGLTDELLARSSDFARLWDEHDVEVPSAGPKRYRHPVVGELELLHEVAQLSDEHWIHLYWAEPGSESELALERLGSLHSR